MWQWKLHCTFRDADEFHSDENKQKMSHGVALTDEDRVPWLLAIHNYISSLLQVGDTGVVTCSSLKHTYRNILVTGETSQGALPSQSIMQSNVLFVNLKGSAELIKERLKQRTGHFMPATLLQSQLDTMEEPDDTEHHITMDIEHSVEDMVDQIVEYISL
uniref:Gluconokinase n=1 Tax=Arion vulgaris TaxID=1028688 RepID=A0A0B7A3A5_9EUPU